MKFNFFKLIEDKYKTRLSSKRPVVVRLDGKNICKNPDINMLDESNGGFAYALKETANHLSRKFNTLCIASSDEISILFFKPEILQSMYKKLDCQKVSSLISQEVFLNFNNFYSGDNIFFDARSFNIPDGKSLSYITYRKASAENISVIYHAKRLITFKERVELKQAELTKYLDSISDDFRNRSTHNTAGSFYFDGVELSFDDISCFNDSDDKLFNHLKSTILKKLTSYNSIIDCDDNEDDSLFN